MTITPPTGDINKIRFLIVDRNNHFRELLVIDLSMSKEDFYIRNIEKHIKFSFHKSGKKVIRVGKGRWTLFLNEHYSCDYLNPIFSYIPHELTRYPITEKDKNRCFSLVIDATKKSDFLITLFWVNEKNGLIKIMKEDQSIKNITFNGYKYDGTTTKVKMDILPPLFIFKNQRFYFDAKEINKKGFVNKYEHFIFYKPGIDTNVSEHIKKFKYPMNTTNLKTHGCSLHQNKKDGSYFLTM